MKYIQILHIVEASKKIFKLFLYWELKKLMGDYISAIILMLLHDTDVEERVLLFSACLNVNIKYKIWNI